jgi:hypothetical protein
MKTDELPTLPASVLTRSQYKSYGPRSIDGYGLGAAIWAHVRHDDECGNGHNSFAITATVRVPRHKDIAAGGCMHEEIAKAFPELAPFIKWHLTSTDGPMHYVANTIHLAGDRDCWGHRKGEPKDFKTHLQFGDNPIKHTFHKRGFMKFLEEHAPQFDFEIIRIDYESKNCKPNTFNPKYTFNGFGSKWYECPFDSEQKAMDFLTALHKCNPKFVRSATDVGKGKERELDGARNAAVWPEATDAELMQEPEQLKAALLARLPALMVEFKAAVESLGFVY